MISISQALGTLVQRIYSKEPLSRVQLLSELQAQNPELISLLLLIRNFDIQDLSTSKHLLVLEQLTTIVSTLVRFNDLEASLARFDRADFKRLSKNRPGRHSLLLASSVDGIYPQRDIRQLPYRQSVILAYDRSRLIDDNIVGNKNWETTRSILHHFYENQASQQEKVYLQILLCYKDQLLRNHRASDPFYRLWAIFYALTLQIFQQQRDLKQQEIRRVRVEVKNLVSEVASKKQQLVLQLIDYSIRRVLSKCEEPNQLAHICKCCLQLLVEDQYALENAMIFVLLEDCLKFKSGEQQPAVAEISERLSQRIQDIKQLIQRDTTIQNKVDLISYLLPRDQLFEFFLRNRESSFWNYPLLPSERISLAQTYLQSTPQIPQFTFEQLIRHSSLEFKQALFEHPQKWLHQVWADNFITLCSNPPSDLVEFISKLVKEEDTGKIQWSLAQFSKQWGNYMSVRGETSELKQKILREMVCYPWDPNDKFRKLCKFPQGDSQSFAVLCLEYLQHTKQYPTVQIQSSHLDTMYESGFLENMINSSKGREDMDSYWEAAVDILLNSDEIIKGLLQIEPPENIQAQVTEDKKIHPEQLKKALNSASQ